jgi:hypothetical protein
LASHQAGQADLIVAALLFAPGSLVQHTTWSGLKSQHLVLVMVESILWLKVYTDFANAVLHLTLINCKWRSVVHRANQQYRLYCSHNSCWQRWLYERH